MGGSSGKTNTSTSTVAIPPEILARYSAVNARAEQAATQPFQQYSQDPNAFVAPLNQTQQAGIQNINNAAGAAQPYYDAAARLTARGTSQVNPEELNVGKYMSPYTKSVADTTFANLRQQQQQEMSGQTSNAIRSGAFGGDRSGLAAANLARQQTMGTAAAMAPIYQQGYGQALGAAQQQQGVGLAAEQANQARYLAAGQQFAGLGSGAQAAALQGGQAQMGAGQVQQTTEQAGRQALYNQFLQQQGYPFQIAQFLANIAMGTGALSGNTTTTTQPAPFFSDRRLKEGEKEIGRTHDGQPIYKFRYKGDDRTQIGLMAQDVEKKHPEAVGLAAGYKTVDYDKATEDSERGRYADGGFAEILAHQQQMYGLGAPSGLGAGASMSGSPGSSGYVKIDPNVSISRQLLQPTKHAPPPPNLTQELQAGLGAANTISGLAKTGKEGWDWMKGKVSDTPAEKSRGGLAGGGMPYAGPDDPLSDVVKEGKQQNQMLKGVAPPPPPKSEFGEIADIAKTAASLFMLARGGGVAGRHAYADGGDPAVLDPDLPAPGVIEVAGEAPAGLLPRSVRNNNPGNLEASPFTQKLPGYVGSDGRFARFESPEHGAAAMDTLLQNYGRKGLVTPAAIVNRWSPDADRTNAAGTEGRYAGHIAKTLGIRPDEPIDMNNPDARRGLAQAMAAYESGAGNPPGVSRAPAGSASAPVAAPARAAPAGLAVPSETDRLADRYMAPSGLQKTGEGLKGALTSEKFWIPLLSGLGAMAASPSKYLGSAVLTGLGGGAQAYANLEKQQAEIEQRSADAQRTQAVTSGLYTDNFLKSIKETPYGRFVMLSNGQPIHFDEYIRRLEKGEKLQPLGRLPVDSERLIREMYGTPATRPITAPPAPLDVSGAPAPGVAEVKPATNTDGRPVQPVVPSTRPVAVPVAGVVYDDESRNAAKAEGNVALNGGPEAQANFERGQAYSKRVTSDATVARDVRPYVSKLATTLSQAYTQGGLGVTGAAAPLRATLIRYANTASRALGGGEFSDADANQDVVNKISTLLGSQSAAAGSQESYRALETIKNAIPNLEMAPEAGSGLTAELMVLNQRAQDRDEHMKLYSKDSKGFLSEAPNWFSRKNGEGKYAQEQQILQDMILREPERLKIMMEGKATPSQIDAQIRKIYGPEAPRGIARYFATRPAAGVTP